MGYIAAMRGLGDPIGRYLFNQGCALTGIDSSSELIKIAQKKIPKVGWLA
ncbi:hypothetical protein [Ruegeria sp.]|nr:hypothetical protein [Ruegeria sp.]MDA7966025.1 hypothetical protein [Ruegeria sp.]